MCTVADVLHYLVVTTWPGSVHAAQQLASSHSTLTAGQLIGNNWIEGNVSASVPMP